MGSCAAGATSQSHLMAASSMVKSVLDEATDE